MGNSRADRSASGPVVVQFGQRTVPCALCGKATIFCGTKRCDNCWEVERRLPDFLRSVKGRALVRRLLAAADAASQGK